MAEVPRTRRIAVHCAGGYRSSIAVSILNQYGITNLIELAGGEPVFPRLRFERNAKSRAVTSDAVIAANPEVILASWCGRKVDKHKIREREGWSAVAAIQAGHVYEIVSSYILQPGPASLTEGARQLHRILAKVVNCEPPAGLEPSEALDPDFIP